MISFSEKWKYIAVKKKKGMEKYKTCTDTKQKGNNPFAGCVQFWKIEVTLFIFIVDVVTKF